MNLIALILGVYAVTVFLTALHWCITYGKTWR